MYLVILMSLGMFALAVIFALQNSSGIVVRFLLWQFNIQIALLIVLAFLLGFLSNLLISAPHRLKKRKIITENEKKMKKLEDDVAKYRNMLMGSGKV